MHESPRSETGFVTNKLITAVAADFPNTREVLVSFPDQWELIYSFQQQNMPRYAAALPRRQERSRRDHFYGLSPELNLALTKYRRYKLFEPWPQPVIPVIWDPARGEGRVGQGGYVNVSLQPISEAQVWTGDGVGLVWECYSFGSTRRVGWAEELEIFWRAVETDMCAARLFTQPHDPAYPNGYPEFLSELGYQTDPDFPLWWSKTP